MVGDRLWHPSVISTSTPSRGAVCAQCQDQAFVGRNTKPKVRDTATKSNTTTHLHSAHDTSKMLTRSALCPARAFANRFPPAILAPYSTSTASFSTCTRSAKLQQQQQRTPVTLQSALRSKIILRNASSAPSQPAPRAATTPQAQLTWNDFFALRRTRRRIGQGCSVVGAVGVTYYGLTTMINNGYDATLSAQLGGFDPFMLMGLSTLGMMAVGWLVGPIFGNQVFNLAYRGVLAEFTRVRHSQVASRQGAIY